MSRRDDFEVKMIALGWADARKIMNRKESAWFWTNVLVLLSIVGTTLILVHGVFGR